jgi:UDP-N-acetyl-D-mannosaminuronate dehydrogenase
MHGYSFKLRDQEFMQKIKKIVTIGGCGHVGLPLGIVFANCGLDVVLLDASQNPVIAVRGKSFDPRDTGCDYNRLKSGSE